MDDGAWHQKELDERRRIEDALLESDPYYRALSQMKNDQWIRDYNAYIEQEQDMDMTQFEDDTDLKAVDFLGKNLKLVIREVGKEKFPASDDKPAETRPYLLFEGKEKRLVLNKTNRRTLMKVYGNESNDWVGKTIALTTKEYEGFAPGWIVTPLDIEFEDETIPF